MPSSPEFGVYKAYSLVVCIFHNNYACAASRGLSVQSSFKLKLSPHLIIHSSNIKITEPIGQGKLAALALLSKINV